MRIGEVVANAHHGVAIGGYKHEHISIRVNGAGLLVKTILSELGIDKYINKQVIVVDSEFGVLKGVYAYDDKYLGFVKYTPEKKHEQNEA